MSGQAQVLNDGFPLHTETYLYPSGSIPSVGFVPAAALYQVNYYPSGTLTSIVHHFTAYQSYDLTVSGSGSIPLSGTIWQLKITNGGPNDIVFALNQPTGGTATDIPLFASDTFEESFITTSLYYNVPSGTAQLQVLGLS